MARTFNGSSDKITINTGFVLPADNLTIFAWVKYTGARQGSIIGATATNGVEFAIGTSYAGSLYPLFWIQANTAGLWATVDLPVPLNQWSAVSADGNSGFGTVHFYLNGHLQGNTNLGGASTITSHAFIGTVVSNEWFPGGLAHVAVWNTILTAGEHIALSQGALPNKIRRANLIGYWPLSGSQSPEPDFSGNVNNGVLTGTTQDFGPPAAPFTPRWPQLPAGPVSLPISPSGIQGLAWAEY